MKRGLDHHQVREQPAEEKILVPRAKPLQKEEEELIEIHRTLAKHWRSNVTAAERYDLLDLGLPACQAGSNSDIAKGESDPAVIYEKLKGLIEAPIFPEELLQDEYSNVAQVAHVLAMKTDVKNTIHKIDEVMKREASHVEKEDEDAEAKKCEPEVDMDSLMYHENDEPMVEDYNYTFLDDDDAL